MLDMFPVAAGNIVVAVNDRHLKALLNSNDIDYVIPYHLSGLNKELRRMMSIEQWVDYTRKQNERKIPADKKTQAIRTGTSLPNSANGLTKRPRQKPRTDTPLCAKLHGNIFLFAKNAVLNLNSTSSKPKRITGNCSLTAKWLTKRRAR